jgi:hypothetical protein
VTVAALAALTLAVVGAGVAVWLIDHARRGGDER